MSYSLYYSSGNNVITIADNAANTQTMLLLPGKDYIGYGQPVDQNQVDLLENYASYTDNTSNRSILDAKAIRGQLIFDQTDSKLKFNKSSSIGLPVWETIQSGSLPIASTTSLGVIRVGSGLSITNSGTIQVTTTLNGIVVGNGSEFTTATIGSGLTYTGGTLSATGGGGGGTGTTYNISAGAGSNGAFINLTGGGVTDSVLFKQGSNVTIQREDDNTIVIAASGGGGGGGGNQNAILIAYRWAASQPTVPSTSATYNWGTGVISLYPADWSANPPATSPTPGWSLWSLTVRLTTAVSNSTTTFDWNSGSIAQISAPGQQGDIYNTAYLYQWSAAQPSAPTGTSQWTWASGAHTNYTGDNNWNVNIPANPGTALIKLWTASKEINAVGGTTTTTITWTDGTVNISSVGQNGGEGPPGVKSAVAAVYKWGTPPGELPTGQSTYDWSAGSVTLDTAPSGWFVSSTASVVAGSYLYEARVNLTAASTATTSTVNWSTALLSIAGYAGQNGSGVSSPSSINAYARVPNFPNPISATYTTTGTTSLPNNNGNVWGASFTSGWAAQDPNPSSTASLYITSGIYNPSTDLITWYTPYLASLRVGSLSAITANTGDLSVTGSITAGNSPDIPAISGTTMIGQGAIIYSTGNFAMGNTATNISFNGTQMTLNGNVVNTANIVNNAVTENALVQTTYAPALLSGYGDYPESGIPGPNNGQNQFRYMTTPIQTVTGSGAVTGNFRITFNAGSLSDGSTNNLAVGPRIRIYRNGVTLIYISDTSTWAKVWLNANLNSGIFFQDFFNDAPPAGSVYYLMTLEGSEPSGIYTSYQPPYLTSGIWLSFATKK